MSPTYLYCLTAPAAPDPPAATVGLDGGPVRRIGDAWVSDVDSRSVRATVERIRAHDAVVSVALCTGSTPLPARFGQTFASDDDCLAVLSAKKEKMSAGLARVAGMVEMTVIARIPLDASSGTAYLTSLARREHAARDIKEKLGPLVRESVQETKGDTMTLSHLVERSAVDTYLDRLRGFEGQILGPGAPYSFGPPE